MLEWLKEILGESYTEEIDKKVSEAIGKGFVARSDYNEKNEAYKALNEQLKARDEQLEDLKKIDAAALKEQIASLQEANRAAKEGYEQQIAGIRFDYALDAALSAARAKNTKAVRALLDTGTLSLNEKGQIAGLDKQLEQLKSDAGYLFESDKPVPRFSGPTPGVPADQMAGVRAAMALPPK